MSESKLKVGEPVFILKWALTKGPIATYVASVTDLDGTYYYTTKHQQRDGYFRRDLATPDEFSAKIRSICERKLASLEKVRRKAMKVLEEHGGEEP